VRRPPFVRERLQREATAVKDAKSAKPKFMQSGWTHNLPVDPATVQLVEHPVP
jgi:hypothetical protein